MVDDLKEIYYRNDYVGGEPGMTATSDPEILFEFRRVVHEAQKTPLNVGDVELALASIWPLSIYDNKGNVREIKTADDTWTYKDKSIPEWIELKSEEFPALQRRLIEHAANLNQAENSSQNQE